MTADEIENIRTSRKRVLEGEDEGGSSKRTFGKQNNGDQSDSSDSTMLHLKVLVPSAAAGAIIGKGGETIAQLQKENSATIRMSKANDYFPGTTDRVCLISSTNVGSILSIVDFIVAKYAKLSEYGSDRHKQLKILVTNLIAGKVIGKGGTYIKQLQDSTGVTIQISQKNEAAVERTLTVTGDESAISQAVGMIVAKIQEAPSSVGSFSLSYSGERAAEAATASTMGLGSLVVHLDISQRRPPQPLVDLVIAGLPGTYAAHGYPSHIAAELAAALATLSHYGMLSIAPESTPNAAQSLLNAKANAPKPPSQALVKPAAPSKLSQALIVSKTRKVLLWS